MATEEFTRNEFEKALTEMSKTGKQLWEYVGVIKGEHVYRIPVMRSKSLSEVGTPTGLFVMINSSVSSWTNVADGSGENSIRIWVVDSDGNPMFKKEDAWTTRVRGWQNRMREKIHEQYRKALSCKRCPKCGGWMVVRDGKNGEFLGCQNFRSKGCRYTEQIVKKEAASVQLKLESNAANREWTEWKNEFGRREMQQEQEAFARKMTAGL